ncbi:MAG: hypothetical protein WCS42_11665 [Verrucomicrobiota bacterium]
MHQIKTSSHPTIVHNAGSRGISNSSAERWNESSAAPNCFASIIRDSVIIVQNENYYDAGEEKEIGTIN